jgi:flagellar biosynthesis/type III secretory pathway M-ring protein FliF/YscJ
VGEKPDYRTLYSNLSDQDGGAIVTQLTQMNIPYRFADNGGALEVPADKVHELRLRLAQQGCRRAVPSALSCWIRKNSVSASSASR